jgi:hypothetical protein
VLFPRSETVKWIFELPEVNWFRSKSRPAEGVTTVQGVMTNVDDGVTTNDGKGLAAHADADVMTDAGLTTIDKGVEADVNEGVMADIVMTTCE